MSTSPRTLTPFFQTAVHSPCNPLPLPRCPSRTSANARKNSILAGYYYRVIHDQPSLSPPTPYCLAAGRTSIVVVVGNTNAYFLRTDFSPSQALWSLSSYLQRQSDTATLSSSLILVVLPSTTVRFGYSSSHVATKRITMPHQLWPSSKSILTRNK